MFNLQHLDHVAITVRDLKKSEDWYKETLGLERRHPEWNPPVMLCAGPSCVALFPVEGSSPADPPGADTLSMRHFAFAVDRQGFEAIQEEFRQKGIEFSFADHGAVHSIYINDPDGHTIEITTQELD
jgi:catechol 2,3-dioxygenase